MLCSAAVSWGDTVMCSAAVFEARVIPCYVQLEFLSILHCCVHLQFLRMIYAVFSCSLRLVPVQLLKVIPCYLVLITAPNCLGAVTEGATVLWSVTFSWC